ncbi:hypothetical protein HN51_011569 [Arachis hypogaea]|nr:uncharacterized protein DS421_3g77570 [Arachis hypogaea]
MAKFSTTNLFLLVLLASVFSRTIQVVKGAFCRVQTGNFCIQDNICEEKCEKFQLGTYALGYCGNSFCICTYICGL